MRPWIFIQVAIHHEFFLIHIAIAHIQHMIISFKQHISLAVFDFDVARSICLDRETVRQLDALGAYNLRYQEENSTFHLAI